jgi:hypothetical protein
MTATNLLALAGLLAAIIPSGPAASAVHLKWYSFAENSVNNLIYVNGTLYGADSTGGNSAFGTLFSADAATGKVTTFYTFTGTSDGAFLLGPLLSNAGMHYGTALGGGGVGGGYDGDGYGFRI